MAKFVLDSWALAAFFEDELGGEAVEMLLDQAAHGKHLLYFSVPGWTELYSHATKHGSRELAESQASMIANLPIEIIGIEGGLESARKVAVIKAKYNISLPAAYAAALADWKKAVLVTGDPAFRTIGSEIRKLLIGN